MEGVINYCWTWQFKSSSSSSDSIFTFSLYFDFPPRWKLFFLFPSYYNLCGSFAVYCCPSLPQPTLSLSAPTLGSKGACLTVNMLSSPQREAARRQWENYSVLRSINLHCVTHARTYSTHTLMVGLPVCSPVSLCPVEHIASPSVWVCEDMKGHTCLSMVLNSIFYTLL